MNSSSISNNKMNSSWISNKKSKLRKSLLHEWLFKFDFLFAPFGRECQEGSAYLLQVEDKVKYNITI